MKFKVGDRVRIRKDLKSGRDWGLLCCNYEMEVLAGKEATIIEVFLCYGCYKLDIDNGDWYWNDEMLEPIFNGLKLFEE